MQFIDKAIYAKMPDHEQKIFSQTYLEDKSNNEIVPQLEREMRLNGLGAPDDITLVPLNNVTPTTTTTNNNKEVVEIPVRSTITPSRTVRFENDKNTDTMCIRNTPL